MKYLFLSFVYRTPGGLSFINMTTMAEAMMPIKEFQDWLKMTHCPNASSATLIGLTVLTKQEYIEMGGKLPDEDKI